MLTTVSQITTTERRCIGPGPQYWLQA